MIFFYDGAKKLFSVEFWTQFKWWSLHKKINNAKQTTTPSPSFLGPCYFKWSFQMTKMLTVMLLLMIWWRYFKIYGNYLKMETRSEKRGNICWDEVEADDDDENGNGFLLFTHVSNIITICNNKLPANQSQNTHNNPKAEKERVLFCAIQKFLFLTHTKPRN